MFKKTILHIIKFTVVLYFVVSNIISYGQNSNKEKIIDPILTDISEILPPLEVLFDSAYSTIASYKAKKYNVDYQLTQIITAKRSWLKYLGLEAYYNYGTADYFTLTNVLPTSSQQTTSRYTFGATFKFPVFDIINRKNQINGEKIRYEFFHNEAESEKQLVRKNVIESYYALILKQKLFKIANENYIEGKMQAEMAEKQFTNGEIPLYELSRLKSIKNSSQMQYESTKSDFTIAYLLLQEITGIKFNQLKFIE